MVEQRTENPCVGGSIPSITTQKKPAPKRVFCFYDGKVANEDDSAGMSVACQLSDRNSCENNA